MPRMLLHIHGVVRMNHVHSMNLNAIFSALITRNARIVFFSLIAI